MVHSLAEDQNMTLATKDLVCDDAKADVQVQPSALVHNRIPSWVKEQMHLWGERFCLPEWDDDEDDNGDVGFGNFRIDNGWKVSFYQVCSCMISSWAYYLLFGFLLDIQNH